MRKSILYDNDLFTFSGHLAAEIGINEAVIVQQIHYWCCKNEELGRNFVNGHYWTYNSFQNWQKQFEWMSERTIRTAFRKLEDIGYVITGVFNKSKFDKTKWYRLNYNKIDELCRCGKNCRIGTANPAAPIPELNTETNNGNNGIIPKRDDSEPVFSETSKVLHSDEGISDFIKWYFDYYDQVFGEPHPKIKSAQKVRVHDTLKAFCEENFVDEEGLQVMADAFFNVQNSDHNINHFATEGILKNRYYEALY